MSNNNLDFLNQLAEGSKKKDKAKKHKKHRKFNDYELKRLLKGKTIRHMDKDEFVELLEQALPALCKEIQKLYTGNSKVFEDRQTAVDIFTNPIFVKRLKKALKSNDGEVPVEEIFAFISDLFNSRNKALQTNEEVVKTYTLLYNDYVGDKKIKKLSKEFDCKKIQALSILLAAQSFDGMKHRDLMQKFRGALNEIYKLEGLSKKSFINLIKEIFPKKRNMVLGYLLSERKGKGNENNFDTVTSATLTLLEKMDDDDRKDILKRYAKARGKSNNKMGGVRLASVTRDAYPRTAKTISRLVDTGFDKDTLM